MADAADSKSATRKGVKVRLLSPALCLSVFEIFLQNLRFIGRFGDSALAWFCDGRKLKQALPGLMRATGQSDAEASVTRG